MRECKTCRYRDISNQWTICGGCSDDLENWECDVEFEIKEKTEMTEEKRVYVIDNLFTHNGTVVRMTKEQADAIRWFIKKFNLEDMAVYLAEECTIEV